MDRSTHRVSFVWLLALLCVALIGLASARAQSRPAVAPSLTRAEIQQRLDGSGHASIPPGIHKLDGPIYLRSRQRLEGVGVVSELRLEPGRGEWAVIIEPAAGSMYDASIENLTLFGGGLHVRALTQSLSIEGVTVAFAPGDGVRLEGIGERQTLRDVIVRNSGRDGIVVATPAGVSNNGIVFDHCNSQDNAGTGVLLTTSGTASELLATTLRDCTIQNNHRKPAASEMAEVLLVGLVRIVVVDNTWIENGLLHRDRVAGIRARPLQYMAPKAIAGVTIAVPVRDLPGRVLLDRGSSIQLLPIALDWSSCYDCRIAQANIGAGKIIAAVPPAGANWLVSPTAVTTSR